ncbi:ABC transporter ATP-binding protein [Nordella sp. HKS 07]|uniref:ABC transporter ATP-binding protein n=1 Tax=Nordella sp. HKS 07 TaxID=2712222 RepID=UPI0013E19472|nr:ABC transporter ATP-binding protein [Nordella sp. HKS 07]QIG47242.1 ABC transporter ATP-binding protein [Nordella sp. HKS 07]
MTAPLLRIRDLSIGYAGHVQAVRNANLEIRLGEAVGLVGESGSGKSTLAAAIPGLLPESSHIDAGDIAFKGAIITGSEARQRALRGDEIAMVFQDPMTAFNPVLTIGDQLVDFQSRVPGGVHEKRRRAVAMLARVGIPDPDMRARSYPHELSGGMRQRAAIAAALLVNPSLLIADEPTTALDVTMEAQIIHLFRELRSDFGGGILIVTHHLGVVAELCDRVYVMYRGEVVEEGAVDDIFHTPRHPYTRALLACDPARLREPTPYLPVISDSERAFFTEERRR